jgi:hypothetical protein
VKQRTVRPAVLAGLLALALAVPACSDDDGDDVDAGETTTSAAESTTSTDATTDTTDGSTTSPPTDGTPTTDGIDPMPGADTEPKSAEAEAGVTHLVDVRTGRHEGFDRITFEFDGPRPGYRVEYVEPPIVEDGSGETVEVDGEAFLQIRFEPASGFDMEAGEATYDGPRTVEGNGTTVLEEVVRTGDFEAVLTWVAGSSDRVDFRVTTLTEPTRVVVDLRNH